MSMPVPSRQLLRGLFIVAVSSGLGIVGARSVPAAPRWSFEFGLNHTRFTGALQEARGASILAPVLGIAGRVPLPGGFRLRTGLELVRRGGASDETLHFSFGGGTDSVFSIDTNLEERWSSSWFEVPLVLEYAVERGRLGGYVGCGPAVAVHGSSGHIQLAAGSPEAEPRRVDAVVRAVAGVEFRDGRDRLRLETRAHWGMLDWFPAGTGPSGSTFGLAVLLEAGR